MVNLRPDKGLSYASPVGKALLGLALGDTKRLKIGGDLTELEVVDVFPPSYKYHDLLQELINERLFTSSIRRTEEGPLSSFLDTFYGTAAERTQRLIRKYATLYDLPTLRKEWRVDPRFFIHCQKAPVNFVLVALYNNKKEILIVNSPTRLHEDEVVGHRLLGRPIFDEEGELIEEAVNRAVQQDVGLDIAELEPVAILENRFRWNGSEVEHLGIAFVAIGIGKMVARTYGACEFTDDVPDKMAFQNREILCLARDRSCGNISAHLCPRYKRANAVLSRSTFIV